MKETFPFAVFTLVAVDGGYAATTRSAGRIGLPGGRVEPAESPLTAAYREGEEEGWQLEDIDSVPIQKKLVDGRMVWWFKAEKATKLDDYMEKPRITPFVATREQILTSGYGNDTLPI